MIPWVLLALQNDPFEPLETVELKWLSLQATFLLAIVSAIYLYIILLPKHMGEHSGSGDISFEIICQFRLPTGTAESVLGFLTVCLMKPTYIWQL